MKHEVIKADMTLKKVGFIFECKYFDSKGDINKIEKVSSEIKYPKEDLQNIIYFLRLFFLIGIQQAYISVL